MWAAVSYVPWLWHPQVLVTEVGDVSYLEVGMRMEREAFADEHEIERVLIRQIIERGQADGSIRADADADAAALMTGCSLIGIRMQSLIDPNTDIAPIRDELIRSLRARLSLD